MSRIPLYPLRFEPIYQYRLWGGRRLAELLAAPLPGDDPIGEAWLLSDREDHASRVANGPLQGATIRQLLEQSPEQMLGKLAGRFQRFPLLLKFLAARDVLSVQVHPADGRTDLLPPGESGKTEAWVVLETGPKSCIYAGLQPGTTTDVLRRALAESGPWRTIWPASRSGPVTPSSSKPGKADHFLRIGTAGAPRGKEEVGSGFCQADEDQNNPRHVDSRVFRSHGRRDID